MWKFLWVSFLMLLEEDVDIGGNVGGDCGDKVICEPKMDGRALRHV